MNAACAELYASAFKPRKREETPAPHWTPERQAAMRKRGPQPSDKHLAMSYFGYDLRLLKDGTLHIADILDRNRVYATIRLKFLCDDPETGCDLDALLAMLWIPLTFLFGPDSLDPRYTGAMFHIDQAVRCLTGRAERTKMPERADLCQQSSTP